MNLIQKIWPLTALFLLLTACGMPAPAAPSTLPEEPITETAEDPTAETAEDPAFGIIFTYHGKDYDLRERSPMVNALMAQTPVGGVIVVEGHIGPNAGYYGIFDTQSETFIKDIEGANLTWREDDISTAVYNLWSKIYSYDGALLADLDLSESEYISGLTWKDRQRLSVEIRSISSETPEVLEIEVEEGLSA